ncbi:peptidylprolyl isomerase [Brevundimonas variabilis]|uniref:peptidylprolyl isomerase n=1 Tax=Brevundimonas variabilis TaxID=74312 RepID=A0A7W9CHZ4_9CAUL|nr:peptidylprolyl isomerase [Brevundimonas variabilis]MBB5745973.1 peptidylprolyl isomerase [Brevundimonas variabilis]
MKFKIGLAAFTVALAFGGAGLAQTPAAPATASDWRVIAPENLWVIDTTQGRVLVELDPRVAPGHVERIRTLTSRGFYDGLKFHRVIRGFMAQTGDPLGTGEGGSDLPDLPPEFSFRRGSAAGFAPIRTNAPGIQGLVGSVPVVTQPDAQMFVTADFKVDATGLFCPGVAGMARSSGVDSANSQFFLMMGQNDNLNGSYTVFGRIVAGLDVVEKLKVGDDANNGAVTDPDVMTRVRIASALPETERPVVRVMDPRSAAFAARVDAVRAAKGNAFKLCDVQPVAEVTGG